MKNKHVITITGIRPDFIRMSKLFKKLDLYFTHTLIHTGQHFDPDLSDVFFKDLAIRAPDHQWNVGQASSCHVEQLANLCKNIKANEELIKSADIVLFLGDSNSVLASVPISKMGVRVGHIEAGMRSGDRRMFEEINRITCDHASHLLFTYHENYKDKLVAEGIPASKIFTVGNTIVEVVEPIVEKYLLHKPKANSHILLDIHRPENFLDEDRLKGIIHSTQEFSKSCNLPVFMLDFTRTTKALKEFKVNLGDINLIPKMGFIDYLTFAYDAHTVVSDSGTAQEELCLLKTPCLVPRDFTERPESYTNYCSKQVFPWEDFPNFGSRYSMKTDWLGQGTASRSIIRILMENL